MNISLYNAYDAMILSNYITQHYVNMMVWTKVWCLLLWFTVFWAGCHHIGRWWVSWSTA